MSSQAEPSTRVLRPVTASRIASPRLVPPLIAPLARPAGPPPARARTPIELTVEVLRGPFRPLIVWGLFWGARPFSELMRHVPDVTKRTLRRELAEMERIGLVVRDVRPDSNRRAFYALSPLGETLRPVVGAMYEWGLLCAKPRRASWERPRASSGA
jgi:DNA-binding HxlR family transcriptional regulator